MRHLFRIPNYISLNNYTVSVRGGDLDVRRFRGVSRLEKVIDCLRFSGRE